MFACLHVRLTMTCGGQFDHQFDWIKRLLGNSKVRLCEGVSREFTKQGKSALYMVALSYMLET